MWSKGQVTQHERPLLVHAQHTSRNAQGEAVISLSQTDSRSAQAQQQQQPPTCIGLTIWRCKPGAAPQRVWSSGAVAGCVSATLHSVAAAVVLAVVVTWHDTQVRARGGNSWVAPALVGEAKCSEGREVSVTVSPCKCQ